MRRALLRALAAMAYGGLPPRRPDQAGPSTSAGVAPGTASGTFRGRLVIITGPAGTVVGLFEYLAGTTPALGNPPIVSITNNAVDPFGNPVIAGGLVSYQHPVVVGSAALGVFGGLLVYSYWTGSAWATQFQNTISNSGTPSAALNLAAPNAVTSWNLSSEGFAVTGSGGKGQICVPPSGDLTGATDTANINSALSVFGAVLLTAGTYTINAALTPPTNSSLIGAGAGVTVINQITNAAEGITCNNKSTVTLRGFTLVGKGSGVSTAAGIHFASNPPTANLILDDVIVQNFGLQGFLFDSVFLVELRKCEALQNGGQGFQVTNSFTVPTSFSFHSCYANANGGNGYELDALQYSHLGGCAADGNPTGYALLGCQGVTLTGCGTEAFTATGFLFNNCRGCGLYGGFTFNGKTKVAWITNGTTRTTIGGLTETSPAAGATACVQTDAGTSSVLWGITHVTADSLAAGTFTNVDGSA